MPERRAVLPRFRHSFWMAWLLLAVLLAQTSALMHRVAHGGGVSTRTHSVATLAHTPIDVSVLWGEHGKPADCQLLDDLAHATPPVGTATLDVALPPQTRPVAAWVSSDTQPLRGYWSQAPPLSV